MTIPTFLHGSKVLSEKDMSYISCRNEFLDICKKMQKKCYNSKQTDKEKKTKGKKGVGRTTQDIA